MRLREIRRIFVVALLLFGLVPGSHAETIVEKLVQLNKARFLIPSYKIRVRAY